MPVKKQAQERRRSTRIQHKEEEKRQEEKKRTNLKDLLKKSNSTLARQNSTSTEQDGDFVFKRAGNSSSQPVTELEKGKKKTTKRSRPTTTETKKKPIRRLNPEDVTITPQRSDSPRKKKSKASEDRYEEHSTSFQIALPISDTPIIRRNQKFRKENEKNGIRRSSLGNRGKRVSSIGNGFSAVPHDKVPIVEYYKHLDSDLPDPHKMRQLLTWCAKRVFDDDKNKHIKRKNKLPNEELTALNIAKVIKEEIVRDLSDGKINISWWNREEEEDETKKSEEENKLEKVLLPNEKNVKNAQVLKDLKAKLENLKKDSSNWEKHLSKKIDIPIISTDLSTPPPASNEDPYVKILDSSIISELSAIENSTFNEVSNLEQSIDKFNEFVHTLKSSSMIRSRFAELKSKQLAEVLDKTFDDDTIELIKSHNHNKEDADTHQLLQGISRLDQ